MFRKVPVVRRSSQPKRLSSALLDVPDEKIRRSTSDDLRDVPKRSFIPRPTMGIPRSSSLEREAAARSTSRSSRSKSVEPNNAERGMRSRSTENLITPKNLMKTPNVGLSKPPNTSCKKSMKRDTRPLADRGYQNAVLYKVHEYLREQLIIESHQVNEVRCPVTLKLFIHIMNSLIQKICPISLNVGNYSEIIPSFMKKLKYPGTINRSWLVTANSPHSWPSVLGIISWLVTLLCFSSPPLIYIQESDLNLDKVVKLMSYNARRYRAWSESEEPMISDEDDQFFNELFIYDLRELQEEQSAILKEVEALELLESQNSSPEEVAANQKLENMLGEISRRESQQKQTKEIIEMKKLSQENKEKKIIVLKTQNEELKHCIATFEECKTTKNEKSGSTLFSEEDISKLQSEIGSFENIVKLQNTHISEITNKNYAIDLALARLKAESEKNALQRGAILRECTSELLSTSELQFNINHSDEYEIQMQNHLTNLQERINNLKDMLKETSRKEKQMQSDMNKANENNEQSKEADNKEKVECKQLKKNGVKENKNISDLEREMKMFTEELNLMNEQISKEQFKLGEMTIDIEHLKSESGKVKEMLEKYRSSYTDILQQCNQIMCDTIRECKEKLRRVVKVKVEN